MISDFRLRIGDRRLRMRGQGRAPFRSALRNRQSAFTLIEVLIAMFIFLIGIMGILSLFPVAMNAAGRAVGEARAGMLAQSAVAQFTADCTIPFDTDTVAAGAPAEPACEVRRVISTTDRTGYFVTLIKPDTDAYPRQCRLIVPPTAPGDVLRVCPDWTSNPVPGDRLIVTRLGLPDPYLDDPQVREGYVYAFVDTDASAFRAGVRAAEDVQRHWWPTRPWTPSVPVAEMAATGGSANTLTQGGPVWTVNALRGKLAVITQDNHLPDEAAEALGQVRLIVANDATTLTVYPPWTIADPATFDWTQCQFEVRDRLGYFVLITSGRAAGRIAPITAMPDTDTITCAGMNWADLGVTAAKNPADAGGDEYKARNATTFMILGSRSFLCTALPFRTEDTALPLNDYFINSFGIAKRSEPQAGPDVYFTGSGTATESAASEYDAVGIFSDSGRWPITSTANRMPVRLDVITWRNYDRTKSPAENRRPTGFNSGFIPRP